MQTRWLWPCARAPPIRARDGLGHPGPQQRLAAGCPGCPWLSWQRAERDSQYRC